MSGTWLYKPGHILANERGFVTKEDYHAHKFYTEPDLRMMNGNEPVVVHYIADEMPPTRHMACPIGHKLYTSKKKFRDETKARGCTEVGNNVEGLAPKKYIPPTDRRERREAIRHSIKQLREGALPEAEKAIIKRTAEIANYQARNNRKIS